MGITVTGGTRGGSLMAKLNIFSFISAFSLYSSSEQDCLVNSNGSEFRGGTLGGICCVEDSFLYPVWPSIYMWVTSGIEWCGRGGRLCHSGYFK